MSVAVSLIAEEPLDIATHVAAVSGPSIGGIATFVGTVRDIDPSVEGTVVGLDYTAHPDAAAHLDRIAATVAGRHPGVTLAVTHRIGSLAVGDLAIVAAAGATHRAEAFAACSDLVETVKAELPIWKRERLADGTHTWVGL